jgi:hypothetical protein
MFFAGMFKSLLPSASFAQNITPPAADNLSGLAAIALYCFRARRETRHGSNDA